MLTILRVGSYRFYFYSYDCGESRHTHADRENRSAKFWLDPDARPSQILQFGQRELRSIQRILR